MKSKHKLKWEYCECGCHCHEANAGGEHFTVYNDLKGGFWLNTQHGAGGTKYKSWEEADAAAYALAKAGLKKCKEGFSVNPR